MLTTDRTLDECRAAYVDALARCYAGDPDATDPGWPDDRWTTARALVTKLDNGS